MGWYLRKSLNLGPIRINLSKSGLGLSAGLKGLRVGTGPRGKYMHAGRGGLYYRTSLESPVEPTAGTQAQDADPELDDVTEINRTSEERLAAARWARISARAEQLRDENRKEKPGFFSSFINGIFGGLLRGR